MFKQFLTIINHPRLKSFQVMKMERLEMDWQTLNNSVDCGVFLMRHMEVYRGGGSDNFPGDLEPELDGQAPQLAELRKKYVAKILLSDFNLCKASFLKTLDEYDKMKTYWRKKIYEEKNVLKIQARIESIGVL